MKTESTRKRNFKSIETLAKRCNNISFYTLLSKRAYLEGVGWCKINNLLDEQVVKNMIDTALGGNSTTKHKLNTVLNSNYFSVTGGVWMFERIKYLPKSKAWLYYAGQEYPSELRQVKKFITNQF